jgi:trimeric autotransporter adhesin
MTPKTRPPVRIRFQPSLAVSVNGRNFLPVSVVQWKGGFRTTTYVSSTQLSVTITAADIAAAGPAEIAVFNPSPGGGTSNSATFTTNSGVPALASLSPASIAAGSARFTLTATGTNFLPSSKIQWNGSDRPTTFISGTQLTATIASGDIATQGAAQVTVANLGSGGGTSSATLFTITVAQASIPAITSLAPASLTAGLTGFALTVNGTGLVAGSIAQWNGANRATIVMSSTQLLFAPLPEDNAVAGNASVSVLNPAPGGLSGSTSVTVSALAPNAIGVTDRLSVAGDFAEANGDSQSVAISADGRFVAFVSSASNLVPGDTNAFQDIFVRDTCRGSPAGCTPSITRVSIAGDGSQGNAESFAPAISANGRFTVFLSSSTNLASGDTNGTEDIFMRDTCIGASSCIPSTTLVSLASDGSPVIGTISAPAISADARFVAFASSALTLVPGDSNGTLDVFVRDTCIGASSCTPSTALVSVANDGSPSVGHSSSPAISANGRMVSFVSTATNLVAGDTNGMDDIFVRDTCIAASGCTPSTVRVSVDSAGVQGNGQSFLPRISGNGRHVVYSSWASNLVAADTGNNHDVFVRDTCFGAAGACTPSTVRVSVNTGGTQADASSGGPATQGATISADGRFVAFGSRATNLVANDTNGAFDIFLRDTCAGASGCAPATIRPSVALEESQPLASERSDQPVLTADGRLLFFVSSSATFLPGDTNSRLDVFLARTGAP